MLFYMFQQTGFQLSRYCTVQYVLCYFRWWKLFKCCLDLSREKVKKLRCSIYLDLGVLTCQHQHTLISTTTTYSGRQLKNKPWNISQLFWTTSPRSFPPCLHPSIISPLFWFRYDINISFSSFTPFTQSWITPIKVRFVSLSLSLSPSAPLSLPLFAHFPAQYT